MRRAKKAKELAGRRARTARISADRRPRTSSCSRSTSRTSTDTKSEGQGKALEDNVVRAWERHPDVAEQKTPAAEKRVAAASGSHAKAEVIYEYLRRARIDLEKTEKREWVDETPVPGHPESAEGQLPARRARRREARLGLDRACSARRLPYDRWPCCRSRASRPYALRALAELARAGGDGPVPIGELARRRDIPVQFLEQLFAVLRRGGILRSQRGVKGGYSFAREPSEVTVLEIVEMLDGKLGAGAESIFAEACRGRPRRARRIHDRRRRRAREPRRRRVDVLHLRIPQLGERAAGSRRVFVAGAFPGSARVRRLRGAAGAARQAARRGRGDHCRRRGRCLAQAVGGATSSRRWPPADSCS